MLSIATVIYSLLETVTGNSGIPGIKPGLLTTHTLKLENMDVLKFSSPNQIFQKFSALLEKDYKVQDNFHFPQLFACLTGVKRTSFKVSSCCQRVGNRDYTWRYSLFQGLHGCVSN